MLEYNRCVRCRPSDTHTCVLDVCCSLVELGAQRRRAHVQHADPVHAHVKQAQGVCVFLVVMVKDLGVDEGGERLRLQETRQEGEGWLRLVRQEGCLGVRQENHIRKWWVWLELLKSPASWSATKGIGDYEQITNITINVL